MAPRCSARLLLGLRILPGQAGLKAFRSSISSTQIFQQSVNPGDYTNVDNFGQVVSCDALAPDIPPHIKDEIPMKFAAVTGDIPFSGQSSEYDLALGYFDSHLRDIGLDAERLCIVPGNHDVDRSR